MAEAATLPAAPRRRHGGLWAGLLAALLLALAVALTLRGITARLPPSLAWQALSGTLDDARQVIFLYGDLPRLAMALLAGGGLALAGTLFQQVLRNPLASPTTLGTAAGAHLAVSAALALAPGLLAWGREWLALAGALAAMLAVLGLTWRRGLSPVSVILAGLVVNLYCGALEFTLTLFHQERMISVFIWGAGSLVQNDWAESQALAIRLAVLALLTLPLLRPLSLLDLGEEGGRSLGLSVASTRLLGLGLGVAATACVVAAVGVIGFVGLAAPVLARLLGARRFGRQLLVAPLLGALLLWFTDQLVQFLTGPNYDLPTGTLTAVVVAPVLIALLPRLRGSPPQAERGAAGGAPRLSRPGRALLLLALALLPVLALGLAFGRDAAGWSWAVGETLQGLLPWRAPRLATAMAAGVLLGLAGGVLQRLSGNPMASPEVLGISSGAALGVLLAVLLVPGGAGQGAQLLGAALGAGLALAALLLLGRRMAYAPERLLLAGLVLGTVCGTVVTLLMASGDPRALALRAWMAGSTYRAGPAEAWSSGVAALLALAVLPLAARWLDVLPLGPGVARALGLRPAACRALLLLAASLLTAAATLAIGPLSFTGLMAPHIARLMGFARALPQLLGAALVGALIMGAADWAGRNLLFPYQLPVGLVATFLGGPYLIWLLRARR
ncbi:Fe(3+)-hydroxamate ABC transporter permease FhuB [Pseudoroseomonas cervicalis]|uniref:Fe(3+)-hydroxamate ABC transporter permease FhuB n=1 Tax=Teichococcus cervicalis TaxID=204525 RepID=UPI00278B11D3|nr:Fe(3+)-hydroxamate ABC transporter permease FhuB [Pseudoroseomonas cervicalis]MDQ1081791.1 ABC-type Fe3+-siderophore transport system permease subunit [Pseudoroseomonas cervicalis]